MSIKTKLNIVYWITASLGWSLLILVGWQIWLGVFFVTISKIILDKVYD